MKKSILAIAALALLAACENEIDYKPISTGNELIMNSLLTVGDTLHTVWLGVSTPNDVKKVSGASVKFFVNGTLAATAGPTDTEGWNSQMTRFQFKADFAPGDEVRLEVSADGGFAASATLTVPSAPVMEKVDTTWTSIPRELWDGSIYYEKYINFEVLLRDAQAGESDYYQLRIRYFQDWEGTDDKGVVTTGTAEGHMLAVDTSRDLILSEDGIVSQQGGISEFMDFGDNKYAVPFQDTKFDGRSVSLRPTVACFNYSPVYVGEFETVTFHPRIELEISHIQQRYYYYLKALEAISSGFGDLALEDVSIPDNVDGGIGFVGLATPASKTIVLPDMIQDKTIYTNE